MTLGAGVVVVLAVAAFTLSGGSSPSRPGSSRTSTSGAVLAGSNQGAAVESGELPWQLAAPISREVLLPGRGGRELLIAGGLDSSGNSDSGIYSLSVANGSLGSLGTLTSATHDASGAIIAGRALVFGGGTAGPGSASQRFSPSGTVSASGLLPQARADSSAVTIGGTAYVIGGYNGPTFDPGVLSTKDGLHFSTVADLPVPVRYPAVAVLDNKIYAFGGQAPSGSFVRDIQVIDPSAHRASVVGLLPYAISGAAAATLDGTIYLAGGEREVGTAAAQLTSSVLAFSPTKKTVLSAGSLQLGVTNAGAAVLNGRMWIVGGETTSGAPSSVVQVLWPNRRFGIAGERGAGSPFYGDRLLIADRGNNRLLLLDSADKIIWQYPSRSAPAPKSGFYFPDDAFFVRNGTAIISNQEANETIEEIAYPSGKILWSFGHARKPGAAAGYLNNPDDAYLLKNGDVSVADPKNCRVLIISPEKRVIHQLGTPGSCVHRPPTRLGSPNGDTPLADGNLLVSEINGSWIDEYTPSGRLVWTAHLPIGYPSDPQQIGPNRYLVADYENPGTLLEFNRAGRILFRYGPLSGVGSLDQPSLAELLPSGVLMVNDDLHDRMVAIDPATGAVVWQYGSMGHPGSAAGLLSIPDGFDVLAPGGMTPTHPASG